jgi:predicted Na+-dependent transporter
MNLKRIFGALLTVLGIIGLIYAAYLFVNTRTDTRNIKSLVTYGIIGILFFVSGIGLIKTTKDES